MRSFEGVRFHGTFRSYQQTVLDSAPQHLVDRRIHIVAAPGSGKTVLGLELIRRLDAPALVLSPTVVIRQQWGDRFAGQFLPEGANADDYISYNLKTPKPITSITYQALHAAYHRLAIAQDPDDDEAPQDTTAEPLDFSDFHLIEFIRGHGIRTVCLDEAHHLKSEWQKALEGFIAALQPDITIIALTATPPYDSTIGAWNKYISLCGEIDAEIFVPELVAQGTLCPHQDYIFFNYPRQQELSVLQAYRNRVTTCLDELQRGPLLRDAYAASPALSNTAIDYEALFTHPQEYTALCSLVEQAGVEIPHKLVRALCGKKGLPVCKLVVAQTALQFLYDNPAWFGEETVAQIAAVLGKYRLLHLQNVELVTDIAVNKTLISSVGKLRSIATVAAAEYANLGGQLHMLVLTDYIRKDLLDLIGTDQPIDVMGTVPVFEAIRRSVGAFADIALITGALVLWPARQLAALRAIAADHNVIFTGKPLPNAPMYHNITFQGNNRSKVAVITQAFEQGLIQVLVGTKALLGEGWDSPCINSLILASFVGSYVLSNQMRGRAIRINPQQPYKTANIWHLVTVEPPAALADNKLRKLEAQLFQDDQALISEDYRTLKRRFTGFFAPAYSRDVIEDGIARVDIIQPPYNAEGITRINQTMLQLAADRAGMAQRWQNALAAGQLPEIVDVNLIPDKTLPRRFVFFNFLTLMILSFILYQIIDMFATGLLPMTASLPGLILYFLSIGGLVWFGAKALQRMLRALSPVATIRMLGNCILQTLQAAGDIQSQGARLQVEHDASHSNIECALIGATIREKNIFSKAMGELLSPIDNPRYIVVKTYGSMLHYLQSFACPERIGNNQKNAEIFAQFLSRASGSFHAFYTRNERGRKHLLRCRRQSYINRNQRQINSTHRLWFSVGRH